MIKSLKIVFLCHEIVLLNFKISMSEYFLKIIGLEHCTAKTVSQIHRRVTVLDHHHHPTLVSPAHINCFRY